MAPGRRPAPEPSDLLRLRRLFDENYELTWRLLRRFGVPAERVEDAVQQVFLITTERMADVASGSERAFLYGVAVRVARGLARRGWREVLGDESDLRNGGQPGPEEMLARKQRVELCDRVLGALRAEHREVFVLFEIEGLTAPQIAEVLDLPVGTVSSRLRRARQLFRALTAELGRERDLEEVGDAKA